MVRFGEGDAQVMLIAAIHGDEPTSEHVARRLIDVLAASHAVCVAVIPCANPDGLAAHRRTNAHGVDLNRNFPASNWKHTGHGRNFGGPEPLSEPESFALHNVIESLRARLIISIHSMRNPCDNYDGPAEHTAELMSRCNCYPLRPTIRLPDARQPRKLGRCRPADPDHYARTAARPGGRGRMARQPRRAADRDCKRRQILNGPARIVLIRRGTGRF